MAWPASVSVMRLPVRTNSCLPNQVSRLRICWLTAAEDTPSSLAARVKLHGCTVHVVTPSLDNGPIVIQAAVPVMAEDTEESLAERVLQAEHRIYPQAVQWFMEDRVEFLPGDVVRIRGSGVSTDCVVSPRDRNP